MTQATRFAALSFTEQVREALPVARNILEQGVMPTSRIEDETIIERVAALTEDAALLTFSTSTVHEDEHALMCNRLEGAQALGIAIGLLLRSEAFQETAPERVSGRRQG